jgi:hypothetical protein
VNGMWRKFSSGENGMGSTTRRMYRWEVGSRTGDEEDKSCRAVWIQLMQEGYTSTRGGGGGLTVRRSIS